MAANPLVPFLVAMMLVTGVCNTLLTKYQDMQCVRNCDSPNKKDRQHFEQPVIQTLQMFIGEMGCWLVVGGFVLYQRLSARAAGYEPLDTDAPTDTTTANDIPQDSATTAAAAAAADDDDVDTDASPTPPIANPLKPAHGDEVERIPLRGWTVTVLALPACCDIAATTLMNVGLLFVAASIYQMTRGALVLFVGLFSVLFLKRRLGAYKWFALFVAVAGVAIVGLAGAIAKDEKARPTTAAGEIDPGQLALQTVAGVLLIAGAQIFTASQFVLEESIMEKYAMEPIKVVGWEGIFGFLVTVIVIIVLHLAVGQTEAGRYGYFDAKEGLRQITHYRAIAVSSIFIMISIGGFNFFGLSVTRTVSATSRSTIDTCRTLFIWIVSLGLGWETFKWLQVLGFALLVYGTFLFNELVRPPFKTLLGRYVRRRQELLPETPIEHN